MKRVPKLQCGPAFHCGTRALLCRRFTNTNVYGIGSVKIRKTRHEISVDIRVFLQCTAMRVISCELVRRRSVKTISFTVLCHSQPSLGLRPRPVHTARRYIENPLMQHHPFMSCYVRYSTVVGSYASAFPYSANSAVSGMCGVTVEHSLEIPKVAGSNLGRSASRYQPLGKLRSHACASVTKQYNRAV